MCRGIKQEDTKYLNLPKGGDMRRVFSFMVILTLCVAGSGCWWHDREGHERDRQGYGDHEGRGDGEHNDGGQDRRGYGDHGGR